MSKKKNNRFAKKADKKEAILKATQALDTKHNAKNTLLETGKNLVIGVIGGGLAGAAIGKPSLLIGLGITGLGHYFDQELVTMFGIGVMAANGFEKQPSVQGLSGMDGVKERVTAYKDNFVEKLYIHIQQMPEKKNEKKGTDGLGEIQFFNHQLDVEEMRKIENELKQELDHLDHIEKQIENSGLLHMQKTGMDMEEVANKLPQEQHENSQQEEQPQTHDDNEEPIDHIL